MSIRFIIGRAGSGKTHHCYQRMEQWVTDHGAGASVLMLVPQQATYSAQRYLACGRGDRSLLNVRAVSFETLAGELSAGGESEGVFVTARGRRMMLSQVLRENEKDLRYFKDCCTQPHMAARIDLVLTELQSEQVQIEDIAAALDAANVGGALADKLHDLKLIAAAYEKSLGQERIDPMRRLKNLQAAIRGSDLVGSSLILVDGFAGFNGLQIQLICELAQRGREMEICLLMDGREPVVAHPSNGVDEMSIFARTQRTYVRLRDAMDKAHLAIAPPLVLLDQHRATSPAIQAIEREWTNDRPAATLAELDELLLIETADLETEVAAAARQVRQWQMQGIRLRDIGVLCRSLEPYHAAIARIFTEHGIACFIDQRRQTAHHPLIRYVRGSFAVITRGWRRDTVLELIKTGLCGMNTDDSDFLESFALAHGIDGGIWISDDDWDFTQALPHDDDDDEANQDQRQQNARADGLRRTVVEPIRRFAIAIKSGGPASAQVRHLYDLLCNPRHDLRARLAAWVVDATTSGRLELAQEHQQAWNAIMGLLDDAMRLIGELELGSAQFIQTLEAGMEELDLALTPPTLDQVVVGQVDRSRSPEFRVAVLLGLNEGTFPARFTEDPIFSDAERRTLAQRNVILNVDSAHQTLDENLLGYIAFTRAAEKIVMTRALADDSGRATSESMLLSRLRRMIPNLPKQISTDGPAPIATPGQLATQLVRQARAAKPAENLRGILAWTQHLSPDSPIRRVADFALTSLQYQNPASLSGEMVRAVFHSPLYSSISRLETFATCPFKHFARYTLKLEERDVAEFSRMDLGNAFHSVLEAVTIEVVRQTGAWGDITETQINEMADLVARQLHNQLLLSSARNRYLLDQIKKTLKRVLRDQRIAQDAGEFQPMGAEIGFGVDGSLMPPLQIQTPLGATLMLRGRIDRVDYVERTLQCAVYDYKTKGKTLNFVEVANGLTLQLLAYLLVIEQNGEQLKKGRLTPVGAFYLQLLRQIKPARLPGDPLPDDEMEARPTGIFSAESLRCFDHDVNAGEGSKVMKVSLKNDGELAKSGAWLPDDKLRYLLAFVQQKLGELADQVLGGMIEVKPYKMGTLTPCPLCEYRAVCRMDPLINQYTKVGSKEDLLPELFKKKGDTDGR